MTVNSNRRGVMVRLNRQEQENLQALCEFWQVSERQVLKVAFEQLVTATSALQEKLRQDAAKEQEIEAIMSNPSTKE